MSKTTTTGRMTGWPGVKGVKTVRGFVRRSARPMTTVDTVAPVHGVDMSSMVDMVAWRAGLLEATKNYPHLHAILSN